MATTIKTKYVLLAVFLCVATIFFAGNIIGYKRGENASKPLINDLSTELQRSTDQLHNIKIYATSVDQENNTLKLEKEAGDKTTKELKRLNFDQNKEIKMLTFVIDTLLNCADKLK
jgi:hypothetical protein